jgi:hypothetical protein
MERHDDNVNSSRILIGEDAENDTKEDTHSLDVRQLMDWERGLVGWDSEQDTYNPL